MPKFEETRNPSKNQALSTMSAGTDPFSIPPVQQELLALPLDYLFAESCRILRFCDTLGLVAAQPVRMGRLAAPALIAFLRTDLPYHFDDMDEDLLPLVEGALLVGDDADRALVQLAEEHAIDRRSAERLIVVLEPLAEGRAPECEREVSALAHGFAEAQRRHVAWEKAVLYPLAHARLNATSLHGLSRRLARRRGQGSS